jgi:hypothetical protein
VSGDPAKPNREFLFTFQTLSQNTGPGGYTVERR